MMHRTVSRATTRVLLALIDVHQRQGHATVREVAAAAGLASPNTAWVHLQRLADLGMVTWTPRMQATLRPLLTPVLALGT